MLAGNLQEFIREMRASVGPKAQTMGVADASRNAQMAALNQSPFERRMEQMVMTAINLLSEVVERQQAAPVH
jgi:hypothetical protein